MIRCKVLTNYQKPKLFVSDKLNKTITLSLDDIVTIYHVVFIQRDIKH